MKDEFILFSVEQNQADYYGNESKAQWIHQVMHIEHFAVKHTAAEHFRNWVHRVCHKYKLERSAVEFKRFNLINYGGHIEKQQAEYLIKVVNILEENIKGAEDKAHAYAQKQ